MRQAIVVAAVLSAVVASSRDLIGADHRGPTAIANNFASNPCAGIDQVRLDRVSSDARSYLSGSDSISHAFRDDLGLALWPQDSVLTTTDAALCTHLDSLISVWLAGSTADSLAVQRVSWWTHIAVARINPGKYLAVPPILVNELTYNFVVDSVSGNVRFFRTPG